MIPGIGSCTGSSLEDGAQGSMLAKGSSLEDCAQGSMLARAPHWRTVHKGRCLQGIRQGLLSTENDACQSSSLVSSRLHHAALQFLGMLAPLHTLYTVNMYRYGQTTTLMFNSRHCIVQCSVYTVHMYTCTLMGHLVHPYLQHCMVYTVHMYPSGLLVHSCLQQALHCTVYNVHCTHVHIWASRYTRVNSYHCTVQCTVYTVHLYRYGPVSTLMFTAGTALYNKRCTPNACTPMGPCFCPCHE